MREQIRKIKIDHTNYEMLKKICAHGNLSFHENYFLNGNKYFTCLQIFDFPEESYMGFVNQLIGNKNVFVKVDVSSVNQMDYDVRIERAIKKQDGDLDETKKYTKARKASKNKNQLLQFDSYIDKSKETVKMMTLRVYVFGNTKEELDENLLFVENQLSRMKMRGYVQLNDMDTDYKALTSFDNPVKKMVASSTVSDMMMRSEINHIDKNCVLIGRTGNGLLAPNPFLFDYTSYGKVFMSKTGGGKSALVKRMIEGMEVRGNHIQYIFDIHNEYRDYCRMLNIPIASINENTYVNFLQMFYTESSNGVINKLDITNKLDSVVTTFVSFYKLDAKADKTVIMQFKRSIRNFYDEYLGKNINDLKNEDWFVLSDVYEKLKDDIKGELFRGIEQSDIYVLELCMETMIKDYGMLFNEQTNIEFDLTRSLCFDFSFLQNNSDKIVKASYMEMFLNYVSYGFYLNKIHNENVMKEKGIKIYQLSEPLYTCDCLVDEFMECAVSRSFLERCRSLVVYARKAFSGFSYVIHATKDFEKGMRYNGDLLTELFELSVHKYIGEVGGSSLSALGELIPSLTDNDLLKISRQKKNTDGSREFMAILNDNIKIPFTSLVTPFQRSYYGGGA